ncbi:CPBP family intramembrane metalloprotease [bacterium]|nr:CPBP family intramembrane metalloprotease [bacterium]
MIDWERGVGFTRRSWRWWLMAGWGLGIALVVTSAVLLLVTEPARLQPWLADTWQVALVPLIGLVSAVFGAGPLGEELGWRGWLQPRLIDRWSPGRSHVILGVVWAFWHLPLFVIPDFRNGLSLPLFVLLYPVSTIVLSAGLYHVWRNTRGSVFAAILAHGVVNAAAANVLPDGTPVVATYVAAVLGMGLWALVAWRMDSRPSPAVLSGDQQNGTTSRATRAHSPHRAG